ncbi:MAG: LysR substrate-binding domain-containing protein, partial [Myxococcales bacterium]
MRPSIRQLEYLVALADHLHFGHAARACGVTQPALSVQIQQLEELVGAQLIERTPRQILLTPIGEEMAANARKFLRELDDLVATARTAGKPLTGPLRLGVIPTIAPYLLPHLLPLVREHYPDVRLLLREDQTHNLLRLLREGRLDLLLLALPVDGHDLESLPIFSEPFVLAVPRAHPLSRALRVQQAALRGEEVLLLEDGHCLRDQALDVCRAAGARESAEVQATSLSTLVEMVAGGMGVTLLPA